MSLYSFSATAGTLTLHSDTDTATAGYFQLNWQSNIPTDGFALYESMYEDFSHASLVYRGSDLGTVISGKPDAVYYYRVTRQQPPVITSNTIHVTVRHHSLRTAFYFFTIGAIVFIATLLLILYGHRQEQPGS